MHFGRAKIAQTIADEPDKLIGRIAETTLQDLTGDFKQMHVKLQFRIDKVDGTVAHSSYAGHSLTSDYLRRMTRRNHSKVDTVVEVTTKDGGILRVKPFTVSDRRSQTTQERALRAIMAKEIQSVAENVTLNRLVREIVDGKLAAQISKACRPVYPVRRVEIQKTEVRRAPTMEIEEDWDAEFAAKEEEKAAAQKAQEDSEAESEAGDDEGSESDADAEAESEAGETEAESEDDAEGDGEEKPAPAAASEEDEASPQSSSDETDEEQEVTAERKE